MTRLDLTSLYNSYAGRSKVPHRPDLMLAIVLFELRRGQRQPSQWFQDTQENCALWWLGYGIRPSRSCWYEFRDRTGPSLDRLNMHVLHQAVDAELTQVERGAQFIAICRRSKWFKYLTNSPLLALLAIAGSKAARKINSACSNAVWCRKFRKN